MKVVVAMDSMKGSLSSLEAGNAVSEGIHRVFRDAEVTVCPLADGGEGTVEALTLGMNGTIEKVNVTGPLGSMIEASYGRIAESNTAIIEMSAAAGITLVNESDRNHNNIWRWGANKRCDKKGMPQIYCWYRGKCNQRWRNRYARGSRLRLFRCRWKTSSIRSKRTSLNRNDNR